MSLEDQIKNEALKAVNKAIVDNLTGYNGALNNLCTKVINQNTSQLESIISDAFSDFINNDSFKKSIKDALQHKLARTLVSKMDGALDKQVNVLRSNPETKAKITMAISSVLDELISK